MSSGFGTLVLKNERDVYAFHDDPKPWIDDIERMTDESLRRIEAISRLPVKPDFLTCGGSGSLIFQTPAFVRGWVAGGRRIPPSVRITSARGAEGTSCSAGSCRQVPAA